MNFTNAFWIALVVALTVFAAGCDKKTETKEEGTQAAERPEPYTGPLDHDRVMGAKDLVKPFDPWDDALARLEGQLGKPTQVEDSDHAWGFADGEKCTVIVVEKDADKDGAPMVGMVQNPMTVTPELSGNWKQCLAQAGATPPEDANVPGPPEDGSPTTVVALREGVEKAASRWVGKKVVLNGLFNSSTTVTSGAPKSVTISVGMQGDLMTTVGCTLANPDAELPSFTQGDPITVTGTVTDTFGGGLDGCEVTREGMAGEPADMHPAPTE